MNHKGRGRSFTSAEELAREQKDMQNKKNAKARRPKKAEGEESDSEEESDSSDVDTTTTTQPKVIPEGGGEGGGGSESEESSEDENRKSKGVEGLIEIENPNRRVVKQKKLSQLEDTSGGPSSSTPSAAGGATSSAPELSRREREAIEKQKAKERYQKLHAEGKTEEARKDLARLAIIRKQREEAAAKRAEEATQKEALKQTKQTETAKALGKK